MSYSINTIKKNYQEWVGKYNDGLISGTEFLAYLHQTTGDALRDRLHKINEDKDLVVEALGKNIDLGNENN